MQIVFGLVNVYKKIIKYNTKNKKKLTKEVSFVIKYDKIRYNPMVQPCVQAGA